MPGSAPSAISSRPGGGPEGWVILHTEYEARLSLKEQKALPVGVHEVETSNPTRVFCKAFFGKACRCLASNSGIKTMKGAYIGFPQGRKIPAV